MMPTVILTRPAAQSASFAADLRARYGGALEIIEAPLIEITPCAVTPEASDALVLTSANGVDAAKRLGFQPGTQAWCVGTRTAELAQAAGFQPTTGPGDAAGLVAQIIAAHPMGRLAHVRGRHTRGDVARQLQAAGIQCADIVAYDQIARRLTDAARAALMMQKDVIFPLFSPRTATILSGEGPFAARVSIVALSDAVKAAVSSQLADDIIVATRPDAAAMLETTVALLTGQPGRS